MGLRRQVQAAGDLLDRAAFGGLAEHVDLPTSQADRPLVADRRPGVTRGRQHGVDRGGIEHPASGQRAQLGTSRKATWQARRAG
jgi:hypothetical protein